MPLIVGHRGAAGYAPENTLRSFEKALEIGCRAVECDVHLTKDGVPVVIHDAKVDRVTDGKGKVCKMTLAQLKALKCPLGQRLPTLKEVIRLCRGRARLYIELKAKGTAEPVVRLIEEAGLVSECLILSFKVGLLKRVKQLNPRIRVNYLFYRKPLRLWKRVKELRLNFIGPRLKIATAKLIEKAHKMNRKVYVYGISSAEAAARMRHWKVDAFCTDFPALFLRRPDKRRRSS